MAITATYAGELDPVEIASLGNLEVAANRIVEGFLAGIHRSPFNGASVEFAEHRPYTPGDELRTIDWRVWAKSDRYYIKQFEEETNMNAILAVDASGSMALGLGTVSKLTYARLAAAMLARLLLHQRDGVGLAILDASLRQYLPPRSAPRHFHEILHALEATKPAGETAIAGVLNELAGRLRRRGMIVICSDCLEDIPPLKLAFAHLASRGHDLILLHIMTPEELTFDFAEWTRFEDLEGPGRTVDLDAPAVRRHYLAELDRWLDQLRAACAETGVDYVPIRTDQPLGLLLTAYLKLRSKRRKRR